MKTCANNKRLSNFGSSGGPPVPKRSKMAAYSSTPDGGGTTLFVVSCELCPDGRFYSKDKLWLHVDESHGVSRETVRKIATMIKAGAIPDAQDMKEAKDSSEKTGPKVTISKSEEPSTQTAGSLSFPSSSIKKATAHKTPVLRSLSCPVCENKKFPTFNGIIRHLRSEHGEVKVSCGICDASIPTVYTQFYLHLVKKHSTSLRTYLQSFEPSDQLSDKEEISKTQKNDQDQPKEDSNQHEVRSASWAVGCEYRCSLCGKRFEKLDLVSRHFKSSHDVRPKGNFETLTTSSHTCKLCGKSVVRDPAYLGSHMRRRHKMSMWRYHKNHIESELGNDEAMDKGSDDDEDNKRSSAPAWTFGCQFRCKICEKTFDVRRNARHHVAQTHNSDSFGDVETVRKSRHQCKICNSKIVKEPKNIRRHVGVHGMSLEEYDKEYCHHLRDKTVVINIKSPAAETSIAKGEPRSKNFQWAYGCEFRCRICDKRFNGNRAIGTHIKADHGISEREMNIDKVKISRHKCRICGSIILRDPLYLLKHFIMKHKTNLSKYAQRYPEVMMSGGDDQNEPQEEIDGAEKESSLSWIKGCEFSCTLCSASSFPTKSSAEDHVSFVHGGVGPASAHVEISRLRMHQCRLCGTAIVQEEETLRGHLRDSHGGTELEGYDRKFHLSKEKRVEKEEEDGGGDVEDEEDWEFGEVRVVDGEEEEERPRKDDSAVEQKVGEEDFALDLEA